MDVQISPHLKNRNGRLAETEAIYDSTTQISSTYFNHIYIRCKASRLNAVSF